MIYGLSSAAICWMIKFHYGKTELVLAKQAGVKVISSSVEPNGYLKTEQLITTNSQNMLRGNPHSKALF